MAARSFLVTIAGPASYAGFYSEAPRPPLGWPDDRTGTLTPKRGEAVTRSKAKQYHELARECRRLAGTVSTEDGRSHLIAMAEVWERLAAQQERGSDLSEAPPPRSRATEGPVVQQQQQVQPKDDETQD